MITIIRSNVMCSFIIILHFAVFTHLVFAHSEGHREDAFARTALVERESRLIYCSGFMFSSILMLTSCRCLFGFVAIKPYYRERNPEHYGVVSAVSFAKMVNVTNFVSHPSCMHDQERKPFKHKFSAVVLTSQLFDYNNEHPPFAIANIEARRWAIIEYSQQERECSVTGIHVESGQHRIGTTTMIIMSTDDCVRRLCVPKIGCRGLRQGLLSGQNFCVKSVHDRRRQLRFLEGSDVTCGGKMFGLVSHGGEHRYPKVPVVFTSITQYLESLPRA